MEEKKGEVVVVERERERETEKERARKRERQGEKKEETAPLRNDCVCVMPERAVA